MRFKILFSFLIFCTISYAQNIIYEDAFLHIKEVYTISKYKSFIDNNTKRNTEPLVAEYEIPIYASIFRNDTLIGSLSSQTTIVYYGTDIDWYLIGNQFESDVKIIIKPQLYYSCDKIEISYYNPLKRKMIVIKHKI